MSSPVAGFAADLAQTILGTVADRDREPWATGVITNVDATGTATVSWRGGAYTVKRNANYTPVVNDVVLMARPKDQLIILCKIV